MMMYHALSSIQLLHRRLMQRGTPIPLLALFLYCVFFLSACHFSRRSLRLFP